MDPKSEDVVSSVKGHSNKTRAHVKGVPTSSSNVDQVDEVQLHNRDFPKEGDAILVLKETYLSKILAHEKTLEIRNKRLRPRRYWLACQAVIYGVARTGEPVVISTTEEWLQRMGEHKWETEGLPYATTWGIPLHDVRDVLPIPYKRLTGQVGFATFRALRENEIDDETRFQQEVPGRKREREEDRAMRGAQQGPYKIQATRVPKQRGRWKTGLLKRVA